MTEVTFECLREESGGVLRPFYAELPRSATPSLFWRGGFCVTFLAGSILRHHHLATP